MNETTNSTKTGEFSTTSFRCSICKKVHEHSPLNYAARVPHSVLDVPESERQSRVFLTNDQCVIDNRNYFLRGRVAIRIIDQPKPLIWGVWARVRESTFKRAIELSTSEGREAEPPYRGLLDTELMIYGHMSLFLNEALPQVWCRRHEFCYRKRRAWRRSGVVRHCYRKDQASP
jgi:hypothetical protein